MDGRTRTRSSGARQELVLGIDLGTTNSRVARIDDAGRAVIVKSQLGEDTTPSVVCFESPQHAVVGRAAKDQALLTPELVARQIKRDIGTDVQYVFGSERHTPETVSALILRELARATEESTGQVVNDVVITVPAYFGVAQREATRRAGQLADLTVLDVLAEPIAAVLHYLGVAPAAAGTRQILVYDLGGGTFDTTVIRLDGADISVVCTDGDAHLGGTDWDQVIADYLLDRFAAEHPELRPREDVAFMQDLLIAAERLKQSLSVAQSRRRIIRLGGAVTQVELTRDMLEELTADLLGRTVDVAERTIAAARSMGVSHVDDVLLVGGMTKMPVITRVLRDRLGLTARRHEPDLAVAKGAALFGAVLCMVRPGGDATETGKAAEEVTENTGLAVPEVTDIARMRVATLLPRSFGVKSIDGRDPLAITDPPRARQIIVHLLPANSVLPADAGPVTFYTAIENQRMVAIEVWEQAGAIESEEVSDNRKIGEAILKNLPPRLPAQTPIEVTFFMSETGQLTLRAVEPRSGTKLRFDLQLSSLDNASLDQARQSFARYQLST